MKKPLDLFLAFLLFVGLAAALGGGLAWIGGKLDPRLALLILGAGIVVSGISLALERKLG